MTLTVFLAKVIGVYLLIGGVVILYRRRYYMPVVGGFVEDHLLRMTFAFLELLGGLFLLNAHQDWTSLAAGLISLFGWMMAVEGTLYLLLPDELLGRTIRMLNTRAWYVWGGILCLAAGLYLTAFGYGW